MKKNNLLTFKNPFSKLFWKTASQEMFVVKNIVLISLLIALSIVLEGYATILGFKLFGRYVYFSFVPIALLGMLFGPVAAIGSGLIIDVLGFFLFPSGYPFHPGYTLSSVLIALTYGLFLYRAKITVMRLFLAKFTVNFFINAVIGTIWFTMLGLGTGEYFSNFAMGLLKNMVLLPVEIIILVFFFRSIIPISQDLGVMTPEIPQKIAWF